MGMLIVCGMCVWALCSGSRTDEGLVPADEPDGDVVSVNRRSVEYTSRSQYTYARTYRGCLNEARMRISFSESCRSWIVLEGFDRSISRWTVSIRASHTPHNPIPKTQDQPNPAPESSLIIHTRTHLLRDGRDVHALQGVHLPIRLSLDLCVCVPGRKGSVAPVSGARPG